MKKWFTKHYFFTGLLIWWALLIPWVALMSYLLLPLAVNFLLSMVYGVAVALFALGFYSKHDPLGGL